MYRGAGSPWPSLSYRLVYKLYQFSIGRVYHLKGSTIFVNGGVSVPTSRVFCGLLEILLRKLHYLNSFLRRILLLAPALGLYFIRIGWLKFCIEQKVNATTEL